MQFAVKAVAIYSGIVMATLAGAELLARAVDWSPRPPVDQPEDGLGFSRYRQSPTGLGDLVPNQDGHWVVWFHRPYHVRTNSLGLRNVQEPLPSAFRILAVGDSQTFGPYMANEDAWPAWAESILRRRFGADAVQVLNAGIAGYTITDEVAYLRDKGLRLKPDLVMLAVFENDLSDLRKEKDGYALRPPPGRKGDPTDWTSRLGRSLALVDLVQKLKTRAALSSSGVDVTRGEGGVAPGAAAHADEAPLVPLYERHFHELVALTRQAGVPVGVVYIPSVDGLSAGPPSLVEATARRLSGETGLPYLDLTPVLRGDPAGPERLYLVQADPRTGSLEGNGHLSREGHATVGRALADWAATIADVTHGRTGRAD